jgi:prepilin-type N-terminal cleavage/methylation domain-containing protein
MRKGFTLIELVVVIAIIIILAAILLPFIINRIEDSRISRMTGEIRSLKTAVLLYYNDLNVFPNSWDDLVNNGPTNPRWRGPYIEKTTNSTTATFAEASPWKTDFRLITEYNNTTPFNFAGQAGFLFTKAIVLEVRNPQVGTGNNTIPSSSLTRIDQELDDGQHNTGLIVGGNAGATLASGITTAAYTANAVSLYVLLQGIR